jgi:hypothetical protein
MPLIINKILPPHRFESFKSHNARELWNKLFFILSASGLNLVGDRARAIRIKESGVSASTTGARMLKAKFEKLVIFDDENVSGLPPPLKESEDFIILDWITGRSCEKHSHTALTTPDAFVNKVHFYPTDRIDGHHPDVKDIVAISHLKKEQLNDFEYSDTYAKFKVTKMLKELEIRGAKSGATYYALKLEVEKREIRKAKMGLYEDLPQIKFKYEIPENENKESYAAKINNILQVGV